MLTITAELTVIECGGCGWSYAIPQRFHSEAKMDKGKNWRCPNRLCSWETVGFHFKNDRDRLEEALAKAEREAKLQRELRQSAEKSADRERATARTYKGHVTRIKNRVGNGVCPCCNRTFANLARHMESKHPKYTEVEA